MHVRLNIVLPSPPFWLFIWCVDVCVRTYVLVPSMSTQVRAQPRLFIPIFHLVWGRISWLLAEYARPVGLRESGVLLSLLLLAVLGYRCMLLHPPFKWALGIWIHVTSTLPTELSWPPSSLRCTFLCCYYLYFLRPPWESSPWVWYSGQSTWKEHLVPKKAKGIMLSWLVSMTGQI